MTSHDSQMCTCGIRFSRESNPGTIIQDGETGENDTFDVNPARTTLLDASFVHLPKSTLMQDNEFALSWNNPSYLKPLEGGVTYQIHHEHMKILEQLATEVNWSPREHLCIVCVDRLVRAMDADTDRLDLERNQYTTWTHEKRLRIKMWKQTLISTSATSLAECDFSKVQDEILAAKGVLVGEIEQLREAIQESESELSRLQMIHTEQTRLEEELDLAEKAAEQERNSLELEARNFNEEQEQLHRLLSRIQDESMRLMSPEIRLPAFLFNLQVDKERGLRYPLINKFRLAYRPKGDIEWIEIQAAWSLAAHLLIVVGTFFDFRSQSWKVVPLSTCAKLIYYPLNDGKRSKGAVYNLGHPKTHNARALVAWNALLSDLVVWVTSKMKDASHKGLVRGDQISSLPFEVSSSKIGTIVLTQLAEDDEAGWSGAIHCMASDLLWLSDCASVFIRQKICFAAESLATCEMI